MSTLYGAGINLKFYSCNKYDVYLTMICFQDNEDEGNESEGKYHCTVTVIAKEVFFF